MEYKNIKFDAIMATPCAGKSYLCDQYPNEFVDMDEVRLKCKYIVPKNITREELEKTKGNRPFKKAKTNDYIKDFYKMLDIEREKGKTLIASPHTECYDYFKTRNIKFCLVYANFDMQNEIKKRMIGRGNSEKVVYENFDLFEAFYEKNMNDTAPSIKYAFDKNEYLEDILKKFGYKFN